MTQPPEEARVADTVITVRSPELDSFGHVNHAVFLHYLEHARYLALEEAGFDWDSLDETGCRIFVVRIEVEYLSEATRGDDLRIYTWADGFRRTTMELAQSIVRDDDPDTEVARARVRAVWVDPKGRPMRVPEHVRAGLSGAEAGA